LKGQEDVCMSGNMKINNYYDFDDEDYYYHYNRSISPLLVRRIIGPLIRRLEEYDDLRNKLLYEEWSLRDIVTITGHLATPFDLNTAYRRNSVSLSDQSNLKSAVRDIDFNLHLDIRLDDNRMPLYYLCRVRRDYWGEYSLIAEDLYMSPGYPVTDERFMKMMCSGHDSYFLRMSHFRPKIEKMLKLDDSHDADKIDAFIYDIGRHVFQAAWHEDQRLAVMTARHLELTTFMHAIELLYLCLSGELCELREVIDETSIRFFEEVYEQPGIKSFLKMLGGLEGGMLNNLPLKAGDLYKKLSVSFSKFLSTEVSWGARSLSVPLWKLLCGNFSRFDIIGGSLKRSDQVVEARDRLERDAQIIIRTMLNEVSENNTTAKDGKEGR
ncbi:MAG: hypothetical protein AB1499_11580, partial [Nitrospirota bacterium]